MNLISRWLELRTSIKANPLSVSLVFEGFGVRRYVVANEGETGSCNARVEIEPSNSWHNKQEMCQSPEITTSKHPPRQDLV